MDLYPLTFKPVYKKKIWGGRALERIFGRELPDGNIGESWDLTDLNEGVSVVAAGALAGQTLTDLTARLGALLLGRAEPAPDGRFPLLLKLLDANDILSLQVHPDADAVAAIGPPAAMKTECWQIIESRDGFIYKGVLPGVTPQQFRGAIDDDSVEQLVRRIDVKAGEFYYLPAGTVHALGAGVVLAEIQTPSDTTYRVTDWGRGREIHVDRSMQCIRFVQPGDRVPAGDLHTLVATPHFSVQRYQLSAKDSPLVVAEKRCVALMFVGGAGGVSIDYGTGKPIIVRPGDTALIPAALDRVTVRPADCTDVLRITLPEKGVNQ